MSKFHNLTHLNNLFRLYQIAGTPKKTHVFWRTCKCFIKHVSCSILFIDSCHCLLCFILCSCFYIICVSYVLYLHWHNINSTLVKTNATHLRKHSEQRENMRTNAKQCEKIQTNAKTHAWEIHLLCMFNVCLMHI